MSSSATFDPGTSGVEPPAEAGVEEDSVDKAEPSAALVDRRAASAAAECSCNCRRRWWRCCAWCRLCRVPTRRVVVRPCCARPSPSSTKAARAWASRASRWWATQPRVTAAGGGAGGAVTVSFAAGEATRCMRKAERATMCALSPPLCLVKCSSLGSNATSLTVRTDWTSTRV